MFWLLLLLPFFTKDSKTLITNRHDFQYFEFALSSNFYLEVLILLHFSISLSCKLTLAGTGYDLSLFLVYYNYAWPSSLYHVVTHWTSISHNYFTSSFSTTFSGTCSCQFWVCSNQFFFTMVLMDFLSYIVLLICTGDFRWSYQCDTLHTCLDVVLLWST